MAEAVVRKVIHVDMDAFFASVEQRDDPSLRGRPVAVGGSRERGVVAAASYEARAFGVRSAMPSVTARRKCPGLLFVKPRFEAYREVSDAIRAILAEYTPLVEPPSLDEAYLDVTENLKGIPLARTVAEEIRARIRTATGLTASAGVSYNKFLAKMASDERKPDGLFVIPPERGAAYVAALPIGKFHGVGPSTAERMRSLGIVDGRTLAERPLDFLERHFGKMGAYFHGIARGIDERPVTPDRIRRSAGAENTFDRDIATLAEALDRLGPVVDKVWTYCERSGDLGRTVTLKVKYSDFSQVGRRFSLPTWVPDRDALWRIASTLAGNVFPTPRGVRLLGVTLSNLRSEEEAERAASPGQLGFDFEPG